MKNYLPLFHGFLLVCLLQAWRFSLLVYILARTTRWGHQFWLLAQDYISPKHSIKPLCYFWAIVLLDLVSVRLDILLTNWHRALYNA